MKILFDNNVILDVLLNRQPFVVHAQQLFALIETATIDGAIAATSINDLYYILTKLQGKLLAKETIRQLLLNFSVVNVTEPVIVLAMNSQMNDLEDAILDCAAWHSDVDAIVTRDINDFAKALTPVYTPQQLLAILYRQ